MHRMEWLSQGKAVGWFAGVMFIVFAGVILQPGVVRAQSRWLQNVEMITPIKDELVTRALLDTLSSVIQREPVALKRTPDDADTLAYSDLEEALLNAGLDFTSASHLFIGYRLEANQRRFQSHITHLFFIYRPEDIDAVDIPIFYLDAEQPAIDRVLRYSGTPLPYNEVGVQPFREQMVFHKLPESTIVRVSDRVIRDPAEAAAEKRRLMTTIRRFVFN